MPNEVTFPLKKIDLEMKNGETMTIRGEKLNTALQYIPTQGYPQLLQKMRDFTFQLHTPPKWTNTDLIITNGSQDGISKTLEMIVEEGDIVLVQNPLYAGTEIILKPFKTTLMGIEQDECGIIPDLLRNVLSECRQNLNNNHINEMPKILYLNPTGSNPNGSTMTLERKREVYQICCQYNILILEDEAYYFINFTQKIPKSFLSIDVEGRVIRFDSMSKVLSSGLRVAWLTGPKPLVKNIELHIQSSFLHPSTLSQVIMDEIFSTWDHTGLLSHFAYVCRYYEARRDFTIACMEKYLKSLCEWKVPSGGMFVWFQVNDIPDVYEMLMTKALRENITLVPGHAFMVDPNKPCNFIRASYSKAPLNQIDNAIKILSKLIRKELNIKN